MDPNNLNWFDNVEARPHPWPGLMWVTPMFAVPDVTKAKNFYRAAFGMVPIFELADEQGTECFVRMRYRGANFCLTKENFDGDMEAPCTTQHRSPCLMYLYVDDAEKSYETALSLGAESLFHPQLTFWQDLRARIRCPFGYIWDIAEKK